MKNVSRMTLPVRSLVAAALVVGLAATGSIAASTQSQTIGAGVTDRAVTSIEALYATPDKFVGKTVRLEGVVTSVCTSMGCWMALAPADKADQTVRFKVDHGTGLVFPVSARGRAASAEGVFEKIESGDEEAMEAAAEQGATGRGAEFGSAYQIKAIGAVIR